VIYQRPMKFVLIAGLAACGGSSSEKPQAAPITPKADPSCPMTFAGTSVSEEDTTNGGALVFVTSPASIDGVRKAAATLAQMHNQHSGPGDAMGMMISTKSTSVVEEVPTGLRIVFTPASPDDTAALQNELRMHASHLQPGSCEMKM
jgi:hypothetical protein